MASTDDSSAENYESGPTCASGSAIIYAWALDAEKTELPKGLTIGLRRFSDQCIFLFLDVAFKIGGTTSIKYLVLQVHYANIDKFKSNAFHRSSNFQSNLVF